MGTGMSRAPGEKSNKVILGSHHQLNVSLIDNTCQPLLIRDFMSLLLINIFVIKVRHLNFGLVVAEQPAQEPLAQCNSDKCCIPANLREPAVVGGQVWNRFFIALLANTCSDWGLSSSVTSSIASKFRNHSEVINTCHFYDLVQNIAEVMSDNNIAAQAILWPSKDTLVLTSLKSKVETWK